MEGDHQPQLEDLLAECEQLIDNFQLHVFHGKPNKTKAFTNIWTHNDQHITIKNNNLTDFIDEHADPLAIYLLRNMLLSQDDAEEDSISHSQSNPYNTQTHTSNQHAFLTIFQSLFSVHQMDNSADMKWTSDSPGLRPDRSSILSSIPDRLNDLLEDLNPTKMFQNCGLSIAPKLEHLPSSEDSVDSSIVELTSFEQSNFERVRNTIFAARSLLKIRVSSSETRKLLLRGPASHDISYYTWVYARSCINVLYETVWWFDCSSFEELFRSMLHVCSCMGNQSKELGWDYICTFLRVTLERNPGWLLIFDGLQDSFVLNCINKFIPSFGGHVLVVTPLISSSLLSSNFNSSASLDLLQVEDRLKFCDRFSFGLKTQNESLANFLDGSFGFLRIFCGLVSNGFGSISDPNDNIEHLEKKKSEMNFSSMVVRNSRFRNFWVLWKEVETQLMSIDRRIVVLLHTLSLLAKSYVEKELLEVLIEVICPRCTGKQGMAVDSEQVFAMLGEMGLISICSKGVKMTQPLQSILSQQLCDENSTDLFLALDCVVKILQFSFSHNIMANDRILLLPHISALFTHLSVFCNATGERDPGIQEIFGRCIEMVSKGGRLLRENVKRIDLCFSYDIKLLGLCKLHCSSSKSLLYQCYECVARDYYLKGEYTKSVGMFQCAVDLEDKSDESHAEMFLTLAETLCEDGRFEIALDWCVKAMDIMKTLKSRFQASPEVAVQCHLSLACICNRMGRFNEAEIHALKAFDILHLYNMQSFEFSAKIGTILGEIYFQKREFDVAIHHLILSLSSGVRSHHLFSSASVELIQRLSKCLTLLDSDDMAIKLLKLCLKLQEILQGSCFQSHSKTHQLMYQLASCYVRKHDHQSAIVGFERALHSCKLSKDSKSPQYVQILVALAFSQRAVGKISDAVVSYRAALDLAVALSNGNPVLCVAQIQQNLAMSLIELGDCKVGVDLLLSALDIRLVLESPTNLHVLGLYRILGQVYECNMMLDEAISAWRVLLKLLRQVAGEHEQEVGQLREHLIDLYEARRQGKVSKRRGSRSSQSRDLDVSEKSWSYSVVAIPETEAQKNNAAFREMSFSKENVYGGEPFSHQDIQFDDLKSNMKVEEPAELSFGRSPSRDGDTRYRRKKGAYLRRLIGVLARQCACSKNRPRLLDEESWTELQ
jgi:tetratricopeptide (TPR) repeat protein